MNLNINSETSKLKEVLIGNSLNFKSPWIEFDNQNDLKNIEHKKRLIKILNSNEIKKSEKKCKKTQKNALFYVIKSTT